MAQHNRVKLLIIAANPVVRGSPKLRLDKEQRHITDAILTTGNGHSFEIISEWAVTPSHLENALLRHRPDIVHVMSHAGETGIIFEMDDLAEGRRAKKRKGISVEALAGLFHSLKGNIRLVFLNTCLTKEHAGAIGEFIDCAIGMQGVVGDREAIAMSESFYRALAYGLPVQESFDVMVSHIELQNSSFAPSPVLYCRDDQSKLTVIGTERPRQRTRKTVTEASKIDHAKGRSAAVGRGSAVTCRGSEESAARRQTERDAAIDGSDLTELKRLKTDLEELLKRLSALISKNIE